MKPPIIALLVLGIVAAGCPSNPPTNASISETDWHYISAETTAETAQDAAKESIHFRLQAADSSVAGYTGCNRFMGSYTPGENFSIAFSKMGSTRMACPDQTVNEQAYLQIFEDAARYALNGDTLILKDKNGNPLGSFYRDQKR